MTTSSVRTEVLLPPKGVSVARIRHSSGVSLIVMPSPSRRTEATRRTAVESRLAHGRPRAKKQPGGSPFEGSHPGHRTTGVLLRILARGLCPLDGRLHEPGEQRVRTRRTRAQ